MQKIKNPFCRKPKILKDFMFKCVRGISCRSSNIHEVFFRGKFAKFNKENTKSLRLVLTCSK